MRITTFGDKREGWTWFHDYPDAKEPLKNFIAPCLKHFGLLEINE